jgi:hypothetical protein
VEAFPVNWRTGGAADAMRPPNPGKINMGSPFSVRPAVAKLEDLKQRNHQLEPLRGRAAQGARKTAARFKREIEFDRRRPRKFTQQIIDTIMVNS